MIPFRKNSAITFVWVAEQLDGGPPNDISQTSAYYFLSELYDNPTQASSIRPGSTLSQHLLALIEILKAADEEQNLSEDLIQSVHKILTLGRTTDGVRGGEYRQAPASMGSHIFPDHTSIPYVMSSLVSEYNQRDCDMFERASWLLLHISSLHPFDDGNGRLGRLLWCFSLICDGLPFPLIQHNDHNKYIKSIIEDSRGIQIDTMHCPRLTSLTVVCIREKWENFINNLSLENPNGYYMIVTFLSRKGVY